MNSRPAETTVPLRTAVASAPVPARHSMAVAILTDVHFWVPVVVLALGLGLLTYLS